MSHSDESPPLPEKAAVQIYQFHVYYSLSARLSGGAFLFAAIAILLISSIPFKLLWVGMTNIFTSSPFTVDISELHILAASFLALLQRKSTCTISIFGSRNASFTNMTLTIAGNFKFAWSKSSHLTHLKPKLIQFVLLVREKLPLKIVVVLKGLWNKKLRWS